jgi:hypothetical protein
VHTQLRRGRHGDLSLIDASSPRTCDLKHCGVVKLTIADVIAARAGGPSYMERRKREFADEQARAPGAPEEPGATSKRQA